MKKFNIDDSARPSPVKFDFGVAVQTSPRTSFSAKIGHTQCRSSSQLVPAASGLAHAPLPGTGVFVFGSATSASKLEPTAAPLHPWSLLQLRWS